MPDFPPLPSCSAEVFRPIPGSLSAFNAALNAVLSRVDQHTSGKISSHSLKTTLLSWSAVYGLPKDVRKVLGYHVVSGDSSMRSYCRDSQNFPNAELERMFRDIRQGSFHPANGFISVPPSESWDEIQPTQFWKNDDLEISPTADFVPDGPEVPGSDTDSSVAKNSEAPSDED